MIRRMDRFVCLSFYVQVNNFSVMLGRSHCFLGIHQYFGELKVSCSRTLHGGRGARTLDFSLRSLTLYLTKPLRPPFHGSVTDVSMYKGFIDF